MLYLDQVNLLKLQFHCLLQPRTLHIYYNILQNVYFSPVEARYLKLKATRMVDESDSLGIAEIGCR